MSAQRAILIVEDEPLVRESVVDFLTCRGLEIVEAANAEEALVALAAHPEIRILFTDVNMPGRLDGCDLAREVHALRPDVGVVLTSGQRIAEDCQIPEGGVFIPKPYSQTAIARLISKMMA